MISLKPFLKLSALLLILSISSFAVAAPFTVTYTDTVSAGSDSPPFNEGETFTISIVLDNGGTSPASQTWTSADVVSITFSMNDAPNTITTVFSPIVLSDDVGSFVTDAAGVLTAVPTDWSDTNQASTVASSNDPNIAIAPGGDFFINGDNDVYFTGAGQGISAGMTNVNSNTSTLNWTNPAGALAPATTAIPTLSQWAMILLSLMLLAIGLFKTHRSF